MKRFYKKLLEDFGKRPGELLKHALLHLGLIFTGFFVFIATTKFPFLNVANIQHIIATSAAIFLGVVTTAVFHEWFHLFGALLGRSAYSIPRKFGVFIFEWDFAENGVQKFYIMSIAGSIGGLLAILILSKALPEIDLRYNNMVLASAFSAFVFGAAIEWPIIFRTLGSKDPYAELKKTTPKVLVFSLLTAILFGTVAIQILDLIAK